MARTTFYQGLDGRDRAAVDHHLSVLERGRAAAGALGDAASRPVDLNAERERIAGRVATDPEYQRQLQDAHTDHMLGVRTPPAGQGGINDPHGFIGHGGVPQEIISPDRDAPLR